MSVIYRWVISRERLLDGAEPEGREVVERAEEGGGGADGPDACGLAMATEAGKKKNKAASAR